MAAPYSPKVRVGSGEYFPPPYSGLELSDGLRHGLIPVGVLAACSMISTITLTCFIAYRFATWRSHYKTFIGHNQYVVLVLNLVIADLLQSSAFVVSFHWIRTAQILAPTPACFAQAWLLHSGDVGSGLFVLAIALHTFYTAIYGRRVSNAVFTGCVVSLWALDVFLTGIGVVLHGERYFVRAGAWCWVSAAYEADRLWCHYFWIFTIQFATILIYLLLLALLRRRTRQVLLDGCGAHLATVRTVRRITLLMMLYPAVYVVLTLPLSAGRMWSMAHGGAALSNAYACVAGALITSCGWVDSLLYTLTRKQLLRDTMARPGAQRPSGDPRGGAGHVDRPPVHRARIVARSAMPPLDYALDSVPCHERTDSLHDHGSVYRLATPRSSADPILQNKGSVGGAPDGSDLPISVRNKSYVRATTRWDKP